MKPKPLRSRLNKLKKQLGKNGKAERDLCKVLDDLTVMINELNAMLPPAGSAYPEPTLPNYKRLRTGWMTVNPTANMLEKERMWESARLCNAVWGRKYTRKVIVLIEDRK